MQLFSASLLITHISGAKKSSQYQRGYLSTLILAPFLSAFPDPVIQYMFSGNRGPT